MSKTWKAVLGVMLIFIFGWVSGAISASLVIRHRALAELKGGPAASLQIGVQKFEQRMTRNLNLDTTQQQQVHEAFKKYLKLRLDLQKVVQPQVRMMNQETFAEINTLLKPEQQTTFKENIAEFRNRLGKNPSNQTAENQPATPTPDAVGQPPAAQ